MTDLRKAAEDLLEGVEAAIRAGDWKVDGACDPDSAIVRLRQALAQPEQKYATKVLADGTFVTEPLPLYTAPVDAVNISQERVDETVKGGHEYVIDCPRCGHCCPNVDAVNMSQERVDKTAKREQEPVAWMHNFIEGNVIAHKPADIGRHPERWTALYEDPPPCKTCQSLAMAVMNDQTYHEKAIPKREWVGLTREEINGLARWADEHAAPFYLEFARAIEAKLKEKNCG